MTFYLFSTAKDEVPYDTSSFDDLRQGAHHATNHQQLSVSVLWHDH